MAERTGFEPAEGVNPQRFSRPPLSTTQPPLQVDLNNYCKNKFSFSVAEFSNNCR